VIALLAVHAGRISDRIGELDAPFHGALPDRAKYSKLHP